MAELLSQKAGVSLEEARAALEENNWDMLDAMVALERAHKTAGPAVNMETESGDRYSNPVRPVKNVSDKKREPVFSNGFATIWGYIRKLWRISLENDFVILHKGKRLLAVPVLVLIVLLLASVGTMLFVLVLGLFLNCQYRFEGRQLGNETINAAMDKMSDLAGDIKESFQNDNSGDNEE